MLRQTPRVFGKLPRLPKRFLQIFKTLRESTTIVPCSSMVFNGASRSLSSQVYAGVLKLIKSIGFFNILAILSAHKVLDVPTWSKMLPRGLQEAPRSPRETPQGVPKRPPRGPKLAPRGSKMPQDGPGRAQDAPRVPRQAPRCPPSSSQEAPRWPQDGLKRLQDAPR